MMYASAGHLYNPLSTKHGRLAAVAVDCAWTCWRTATSTVDGSRRSTRSFVMTTSRNLPVKLPVFQSEGRRLTLVVVMVFVVVVVVVAVVDVVAKKNILEK